MPIYWLGLIVLFLFASDIGKFPILPGANSYVGITTDAGKWFTSLLLPWFVLAATQAAIYSRLLRGSLIETMGEDYIRTARAKGLPERRVVWRHGVRSAITPVVTVLALDIGALLGGAVLTETVFDIPGHRAPQLRRDHPLGLPDRPGHRAAGGDVHHRGEHRRRHRVRVPRSAGSLLVSSHPPIVSPLLDVKDLRVTFETEDGVVHAVDGISYSVETGPDARDRRRVRLGQERLVADDARADAARRARRSPGQILFEGKDLVAMSDDELRGIRGNEIAMIFQDPLSSLHPFYRVGWQLVEAIRTHRNVSAIGGAQPRGRAARAGRDPRSRRRVDQYPHEFSGGMRQRAMIAMALANEPKLLIADEPTTALDVTVQAQILALLDDLQQRLGMAIIIITHDLGVVAEIADEIAVMYAGRIVEHGSTEQIFKSPQHPYTWGLLTSIPRLDKPARTRSSSRSRAAPRA